jgi:hypothetical protein
LLFASLLLTQAMFSPFERTIAADTNTESLELAAMLPDSDVAATMDFNRILNIAAPNILNQDAKKIGHLKELVKTIENQIGVNPYEIRQIAVGFNIPPDFEGKDVPQEMNPTVIIKTQTPNPNLPENWAKRLDAIFEFKEQQAPSRQYMDAFKQFREFKPENLDAEKIAAARKNFEESLSKTQNLNNTLNALPKLNTDQAAVNKLRENNKQIAEFINKYLTILKSDVDTKSLREQSIKLSNRWNRITIDDAQRVAKLDAILKESKAIYAPYQKKYAAAKTLENLLKPDEVFSADILTDSIIDANNPNANILYYPNNSNTNTSYNTNTSNSNTSYNANTSYNTNTSYNANTSSEDMIFPLPVALSPANNLTNQINEYLDSTIASLGKLPATRLKKNQELNSLSENLDSLQTNLNFQTEFLDSNYDIQIIEPETSVEPKKVEKGFAEMLQSIRSETTVNNKKMLLFDLAKLPEQIPAENKSSEISTANMDVNQGFKFKVALGFLDDRTMAIGLEKTITEMLNREAGYKNPKIMKMLGASNNSLIAFAINSKVYSAIANAGKKMTNGATAAPTSTFDSILDKFAKDINFYGSVNYEESGNAGQMTNDITMSLGMFKEKVEDLIPPADLTDEKQSDVDDTFEFAGYLVGKDIFYDLFNSFKAVQMSMTFKFEQKKIAKLVRATPKIIDSIVAGRKVPKKAVAVQKNAVKAKLNKLEKIEDLLTAPELYIDLVKMFSGRS